MVVQQQALRIERVEQGGLQGFPDGGVLHVDVGIGREGAGLRAAVRVDVKEAPAGSHAAAGAFFIPREGDEDRLPFQKAQPADLPPHPRVVALPRGKVRALLGHGDELHIDDGPAAERVQAVHESVRIDLAHIFRCDGDGRAEDHAAVPDLFHGLRDPAVNAAAPAAVCGRLITLDADHGQQVPVFVQQIQILIVQISSVCEDGKQDISVLSRLADDVRPEHRLPAGQQDEADPQLVRLLKDPVPFLPGQLLYGTAVGAGVICPGIAAGAVQIAGAGDAGDQEGRDMLPLLFGGAAPGGGLAGRPGEGPHIAGLPRVFRRGAQGVRDHADHAPRHIGLNIEFTEHLFPPRYVFDPRRDRRQRARAGPSGPGGAGSARAPCRAPSGCIPPGRGPRRIPCG